MKDWKVDIALNIFALKNRKKTFVFESENGIKNCANEMAANVCRAVESWNW